jgi:hypothetical protein
MSLEETTIEIRKSSVNTGFLAGNKISLIICSFRSSYP